MRIRMYLRGLGIGIVVTALIMGLTANKKQTLSEDEIRAKAAALGMVDQDTVLKPVITEEEPESKESAPEQEAAEIVQSEEAETAEDAKDPEAAEEEAAPAEDAKEQEEEAGKKEEEAKKAEEEAKKAEEAKKKEEEAKKKEEEAKKAEEARKKEEADKKAVVKSGGTFTLEIAGGSGSEKVAALLEKGGVVSSAADFDKYLCDHGYDHKIRAGKHVIPAGSDYEAIAKIITVR
ncbi:MAG: hypothetical protein J6Y57_04690 [Lachnospiraceae bacterium]|nr:hypothetical protein [Lachnospiraceae bacterium]